MEAKNKPCSSSCLHGKVTCVEKHPEIVELLVDYEKFQKSFDSILKINPMTTTDNATPKVDTNQPQTSKDENAQKPKDEYPKPLNKRSDMLIIGSHGTTIKRKFYDEMLLKNAPEATRFLCEIIFGDYVLATHVVIGLRSRRRGRGRVKPVLKLLDPLKTDDIIKFISSKYNETEQQVRTMIGKRCTIAAKRMRRLSYKTVL